MRLLCVLVALAMPAVATAGSWWNQDWQYRKEIGFDLTPQGADIAGSPTDVPVLVRLSIANFNYFNDAKPDGSDFRVVAGDDKTPLKFHFERYDAQNQMAFLWVRVPRLSGGVKSDRLFVYYGNPKAATAADVAGTYDNDQVLALHLSDADGPPQDATANKVNASESTAERLAAAFSGGGLRFAGAQRVTVPAAPALELTAAKGYTASVWVKYDQPQNDAVLIELDDGAKEFVLGIQGVRPFVRLNGRAPAAFIAAAADVAPGQWHHVAAVVGAGQISLFVDGVPAGSAPVGVDDLRPALVIGGAAAGGRGFVGELDEVGLSRVARGADWIKAAVRGQGPDSALVLFGADGQREGGQGSYFGTILKNLTVDGWVVIVICLMMLVLALLVMAAKMLFLSRVEGANKRFMTEFRKLAGDPRVLDKPLSEEEEEFEQRSPTMAALAGGKDSLEVSTLFQLYHHGVAELNKRIGGQAAGAQRATVLSAQSIAAIRSAMDGTLTRQQQRLSSQMVLLTIAISGGPFLGLLGTVIGVMITFAAIAASGDVNVNAIAPGTAAALAATVAGLSVAIPSLFGYNWLNTRIKHTNASMRVFVDEFVARVAEQYS